MAKTVKDTYTQRLTASISVAASLDASKYVAFTDAYKPEDMTGFVIKDVRYNFEEPILGAMDTHEDRFKFGLSFLQTYPTGGPEANDPGMLDWHSISRLWTDSTPTTYAFFEFDPLVVRDFTNLDGEDGNNGLLVHPVNLFAFIYCDDALAASINMHITIDYKLLTLTDALYKQLWQSIYIRQA